MLFGWGSCPSLCQLKTPAGGRWTKLLLKYWCLITANQTCPCFQISRAAVGVILFSSDVLSTYWGGTCMAECIIGGIRVETNAWQSCEPPALPAKGHIMLSWWSWIHPSVCLPIHPFVCDLLSLFVFSVLGLFNQVIRLANSCFTWLNVHKRWTWPPRDSDPLVCEVQFWNL